MWRGEASFFRYNEYRFFRFSRTARDEVRVRDDAFFYDVGGIFFYFFFLVGRG